jgi:hypothetical protein
MCGEIGIIPLLPKFKYGYTLSLEGGNSRFDSLAVDYPPGKQCSLTKVEDPCVQK